MISSFELGSLIVASVRLKTMRLSGLPLSVKGPTLLVVGATGIEPVTLSLEG